MEYEVKLFGSGSKFYLIPLSKEQYSYLKKKKVEIDMISLSDVNEYLGFDITNHKVTQSPYWGIHSIIVYKNGIEYWHSDYDIECDPLDEFLKQKLDSKHYLIFEEVSIDSYFSKFKFETNEDFSPVKITRLNYDFGNFNDFVFSLKYNGCDLTDTKVDLEIDINYSKFKLI